MACGDSYGLARMTGTFTARLAYSNKDVRVTARGKGDGIHQNGYVRVRGKIVSGYVYNGVSEKVFYPRGINEDHLYKVMEPQDSAAA